MKEGSILASQSDLDEGGFTLCAPKVADCGRKMTCERIHYKESREGLITLDLSCNLDSKGSCPYYIARAAIADQRYIFGAGSKRRHNAHAKKAIPHHLRNPPDLMVKRHIRMGKDVNSDGEE
jgi:hypothetical protein